ncbi:hypothetical protein BJ165DRAFT_1008904 [Panaeolus papilionaceus]|nr:hypothetical protein BJ165DRAFT_1008904 [Panaeolus papilionaceus]
MRFSIVAQPDFSSIAKDPRFGAFVGRISAFTLNSVSQQIHQELMQSVNQIVTNLAASFDQRIAQVQSSIMNELATVDTEFMATSKDVLSHDMFDSIFAGLGKVGNKTYPIVNPVVPPEAPEEEVIPSPSDDSVQPPVEENATPVEEEPPAEEEPAPVEEVQPVAPEEPVDEPAPEEPPVAPEPVEEPPAPEPVEEPPAPEPVEEPPTEPEVAEPEPQPEAPEPPVPAPSPLLNADWIWTHESYDQTSSTSTTHRAFRYVLNTATPVNSLSIDIAGDRCYTLYINGLLVGTGTSWTIPDNYTIKFDDTSAVLIAVYVVQDSGTGWCRLAATGRVWNSNDPDSTGTTFSTGTGWKSLCDNQLNVQCGGSVTPAFIQPDFNDAEWEESSVQGTIGESDGLQPSKVGGTPYVRLQNISSVADAPDASYADVVPPIPAA